MLGCWTHVNLLRGWCRKGDVSVSISVASTRGLLTCCYTHYYYSRKYYINFNFGYFLSLLTSPLPILNEIMKDMIKNIDIAYIIIINGLLINIAAWSWKYPNSNKHEIKKEGGLLLLYVFSIFFGVQIFTGPFLAFTWKTINNFEVPVRYY